MDDAAAVGGVHRVGDRGDQGEGALSDLRPSAMGEGDDQLLVIPLGAVRFHREFPFDPPEVLPMRRSQLPPFILTAATAAAAHAGITSNWVGGPSGNWNAAGNWSGGIPGTAGVTDAVITTARGSITVTLNLNPSIQTLTLGSGCSLVQPNDADITLTGLLNDGLWSVNAGGNPTDIALNLPTVTFDGTGVIDWSDSPNNRLYSVGAVRTLVNGVSHTIRGAGQLGTNNTAFVNEGLIEATRSNALTIDATDGAGMDNNGLLRARDGATLMFFGTPTNNTDGVIRAEDASFVLFRNGSVNGGTIETTGSGEFRTTTEVTQFINLTKSGIFRQPNDADTQLLGTIVNQGPWYLDAGGNPTDLALNTPTVTLEGSGAIEMSNSPNNRVFSVGAVRTLVNGASHTIRGAGQLGVNNTAFVNEGVIEATQPNQLVIDATDGAGVDNNALLRARNGATLTIYGTPVDNTAGVIRAEDASFVLFRHGSVNGGTIETTGSGEFRTTTEVTQFINLTKSGVFRQLNDADTQFLGTIVNDGPWYLDAGGNPTDIALNSPTVTLEGSGAIEMSDSPNNRVFSVGAIRTLVNGASHTIRGAGQLGVNSTAFVNEGVIEATRPTQLTIDATDGAGVDNNSLLRARNGATLTIFGTPVDNNEGVIRAEDASFVLFRNGSVTGGTLETTGSGEFRTTTEETQFINLTKSGVFRQPNDADTQLLGTIVNNGPWYLDAGGNPTDLTLNSPTLTFEGSGAIEMSDSSFNRIFSVGAVRTLVNSFGHTIRGAGQIGLNNTVIQNKGLIEANQPNTLTIDPTDGGTNFNEGTMRVSGAGGLTLAFGGFENRGLIDIDATRILSRSGTLNQTHGETCVDGTLGITSGNYTQTGGLLTGDGSINSNVSMQGGSTSPSNADGSPIGSLQVTGTYAQGADGGFVVDLGFAGNDLLAIAGNATLGGALQIRLVDPFIPFVGQEFTILTAANINGVFGCVEFPNAASGYFRIVYAPTSVKLVVDIAPPQEADLDFDGVVGSSDLSVLLGSWGTEPCDNAICCPSDLNGDGIVDALDLAILLGDWG